MPKPKAMFGETLFDRDVRCGFRQRDPMVRRAMHAANVASIASLLAVIISVGAIFIALSVL